MRTHRLRHLITDSGDEFTGRFSGLRPAAKARLKIYLQGELHLPALIDGVGDLSERRRGELDSGLIKLRRVEEVDEFGAKVQRTVAARQTEGSTKRDVPVCCSVFPERVHAETAAATRR